MTLGAGWRRAAGAGRALRPPCALCRRGLAGAGQEAREAQAGQAGLLARAPASLQRHYRSTPESVYLVGAAGAARAAAALAPALRPAAPLVEVNPGPGVLSRELLRVRRRLHLYEHSAQFAPLLQELQAEYPDRVQYKIADFFGMWKLAFQDKMDNGTRMRDLLGDLACDSNIDNSMQIVGAMPSLNFIKHLIFTILFHNTNALLGRPELFIAMPSYNYEYLKEDGEDGFFKKRMYRSTQALFQILFDQKVLLKLPRADFLPTYQPNKTAKVMADQDSMYLVHITQKAELPCSAEYLPLLWYFFRPHMLNRNIRVIPCLEQWIPGCGVWLISGQDPPDTNRALSPGKDDAPLPHMTIFTQFGDLSVGQKLTVFKRFVSWPEFEHCTFRATMESNLPKSIFVTDVDKDSVIEGAAIDDTDTLSDNEEEKHV